MLHERPGVEAAGDDRDFVGAGLLQAFLDHLFHRAVTGFDAGIKLHGLFIEFVKIPNVGELNVFYSLHFCR